MFYKKNHFWILLLVIILAFASLYHFLGKVFSVKEGQKMKPLTANDIKNAFKVNDIKNAFKVNDIKNAFKSVGAFYKDKIANPATILYKDRIANPATKRYKDRIANPVTKRYKDLGDSVSVGSLKLVSDYGNSTKTSDAALAATVSETTGGSVGTGNTVAGGSVNTVNTVAGGSVGTYNTAADGSVNTGKTVAGGSVGTYNTAAGGSVPNVPSLVLTGDGGDDECDEDDEDCGYDDCDEDYENCDNEDFTIRSPQSGGDLEFQYIMNRPRIY